MQLICMLIALPETTFCRADTALVTVSLSLLSFFILLSISITISLPPKKKNTPPCPQNEARHLEIMGLLWSLQSWKPVVKMTLGIQAHYMALCKRVTWSDSGQRNIHLEAWEKRNRRKTNLKAEHLLQ